MKKTFLAIVLAVTTLFVAHAASYAGELKGTSVFGEFSIQDDELDRQVFESDYYVNMDGTSSFGFAAMSSGGSFPVYFHTAEGSGSFMLHYGPGTTMDDIISALCVIFNLHDPLIIVR